MIQSLIDRLNCTARQGQAAHLWGEQVNIELLCVTSLVRVGRVSLVCVPFQGCKVGGCLRLWGVGVASDGTQTAGSGGGGGENSNNVHELL